MILSLYLIRRLLLALVVIFSGIFILAFFIEFESQFTRLTNLGVSNIEVIKLLAMITPSSIDKMIPVIFGLAALWTSVQTRRTNEAVAMRSSGISGILVLASPAVAAFCIGIAIVAVLGPINASISKSAQNRISILQGNEQQVFIEIGGYFWFRQVLDNRPAILKATHTDQGILYEDLHIFLFENEGEPIEHIFAKTAELMKDISTKISSDNKSGLGMCIQDYSIFKLNSDPRQILPNDGEVTCFNSKLTVEEIRESFNAPQQVPIWRLPSLIELLEFSGFSTTRYRLQLHKELAKPFLLAAMVLIGGVFTMQHNQSINLASMIIVAIFCVLTIIFVQEFARVMGEVETIHYKVAAWAPPLAAMFIAVGLLSYMESK